MRLMKKVKSWRKAVGSGGTGAAVAGELNDTGQTIFLDDTRPAVPEPSTHPRQDCAVGVGHGGSAGGEEYLAATCREMDTRAVKGADRMSIEISRLSNPHIYQPKYWVEM